eukprot:c12119_g1_i1.p2 GENE.c12119_g1_i1~~c12119_g1_i1.p2  ORF type:complete len:151 (+),score=16.58 c12119_g1_i1:23-454(+)
MWLVFAALAALALLVCVRVVALLCCGRSLLARPRARLSWQRGPTSWVLPAAASLTAEVTARRESEFRLATTAEQTALICVEEGLVDVHVRCAGGSQTVFRVAAGEQGIVIPSADVRVTAVPSAADDASEQQSSLALVGWELWS